MSDEETKTHKDLAETILRAVIKEFRIPLLAIAGFAGAQAVSFFAVGVNDHFTLQRVDQEQKEYLNPKVATLWDEHWKYQSK